MISKCFTIFNRFGLVIVVSLALGLTGCGGGGGGTTATTTDPTTDILSGVFLDSAVQGLKYVTDTLTGTTDVNGTFQYRDGEVVEFYLNEALIGRALGKAVITPIDFSPQSPNENPEETINALRLLQTLDTDSDPTNGIKLPVIADGVGAELNISSEASVQSLVEQVSTGTVLIDTTSALEHFSTTLESLPVQDNGASYVFSHAYSNNNTDINTSMNASFEVVNGEYVFSATLPSGYQINYQGENIGPYSGHELISHIGTGALFAAAYVGITDPNTNQTYLLSFYDANKPNSSPQCKLGDTAITTQGIISVLSSVMAGIPGQRMECSDKDGDYIETATYKFYLDDVQVWENSKATGDLSSPNFFGTLDTTGLPLYQNGRRLNPARNLDTFSIDVGIQDIFNSYSLIEDHTLKVVITAVDSRGATFTDEQILYEAKTSVGDNSTIPTEPEYVVTTFAGGTPGDIDGSGTSAEFLDLEKIKFDNSGNLYVADRSNSKIKKITPEGVVTTFANIYFPRAIAIDSNGNLFVANSFDRIEKITAAGQVTAFAGNNFSASIDGTGIDASFDWPSAMTIDSNDNLYVADSSGHKIRKVTPAGVVTTIAGNGLRDSIDGAGTSASFDIPSGITIDSNNNLYVADTGNNKIRKVTPAGVVTTVAGSGLQGTTDGVGTSASFKGPHGITVDNNGNLYVTDTSNGLIRKITPTGVVSTIAGKGFYLLSVDGIGLEAIFNEPNGITIDSNGNLIVADDYAIRKIELPTTNGGQVNTNQGTSNVSTVSGSAFTGVTLWTSTDVGHFSSQFPLYINVDGAEVGSLLTKAITPPTTCEPSSVSWDKLYVELASGTHSYTGLIQGWDDPFSANDWPESNWSGSITATDGDCLIVELRDGTQTSVPSDYTLVGNWCRSDFRMCVEVLSSDISYAKITSFNSTTYADYSVSLGQNKYRNINKLGPNNYSSESQHWKTDGTSYWDNITITIENSGTELQAGSVRWYKQ